MIVKKGFVAEKESVRKYKWVDILEEEGVYQPNIGNCYVIVLKNDNGGVNALHYNGFHLSPADLETWKYDMFTKTDKSVIMDLV